MNTRILLASDIDGTLLPLADIAAYREGIAEFGRLRRAHPDVRLAYVTGRHLSLGLQAVEEFALPVPDDLVCDVGTSVYSHENGAWVLDQTYREDLRATWQGKSAEVIDTYLADLPELQTQEAERQQEFKRSYYAPAGADLRDLVQRIQRRLSRHGMASNVVDSLDESKNVALIDVLPAAAAKDSALRYLEKKARVAESCLVYAGDSGNDLAAFISGYKAIVVGNTAEAVKEEVRRRAPRSERVFFAPGRYVESVIDGCRHFGVFPAAGDMHATSSRGEALPGKAHEND